MIYVEIYADTNGVSHFRDVEVSFASSELAAKGNPVSTSSFQQSVAGFVSVPAGWNSGWHNSPGDGFAVLLQGSVEIEVGSGEVRRFSPGDVWRSTDVSGKGHVSRVVGTKDANVYMTSFASFEGEM